MLIKAPSFFTQTVKSIILFTIAHKTLTNDHIHHYANRNTIPWPPFGYSHLIFWYGQPIRQLPHSWQPSYPTCILVPSHLYTSAGQNTVQILSGHFVIQTSWSSTVRWDFVSHLKRSKYCFSSIVFVDIISPPSKHDRHLE